MFVVLDVDHTLLKENISFLFGKELFRKKNISFVQGVVAGLIWTAFRLGLCSQERLHKCIFSLIFRGREKAPLQNQFRLFFQSHKEELLRSYLLDTIRSVHGDHIALFSSSPDFMVEEVGKAFGIKEAYGSQYNVDSSGRFTFLGLVMTGFNKAALVQKREKPIAVYTDSADDIPLLEIADVPVAVCPDRRLFLFAQKKGWDILGD
jgi:phosphoserine phosphatase